MAATKTEISPSGSMKGYSLLVWMQKNIDTLRMLGAAILGVWTFYQNIVPAPWNALISTVITVVGILVVDAIRFKVNDVKLE